MRFAPGHMTAVLLVLALAAPLAAKFANPTEPLPADRMIKNAEAWIKEKPADPQGYYILARLHAMVWAYGPQITVIKPADDQSLPGFASFQAVQVRHADAAPTDDDINHLAKSLEAYQKAVELDPKNALYALGHAFMLQEAGARAAATMADYPMRTKDFALPKEKAEAYAQAARNLGDSDPAVREAATKTLREGMPLSVGVLFGLLTSDEPEVKARAQAIVRGYWDLKALDAYRKAYELALPNDLKNRNSLAPCSTFCLRLGSLGVYGR